MSTGSLSHLEDKDNIAVLCDFDGTISLDKTPNLLYKKFAGSGLKYSEAWNAGLISTKEELELTFSSIEASKDQMEQALNQVRLDPSTDDFLAYIDSKDWEFAIVSDGLEWYIRYLLQQYGLSVPYIYANQIVFADGGFRFEFPWNTPAGFRMGVNKGAIVQRYKESDHFVVYLGDGRSDIDAVDRADLLYATGWLADYCRQNDIEFVHFQCLADVLSHWRANQILN